MAGKTSEFVTWVVDQLEPLGAVRARAMFGGYGLYRGDVMFGLVLGDVLHFKADAVTSLDYAARGAGPFVYAKPGGKPVQMSYWEVPADILDDADALEEWARVALRVAEAKKKPARKPAS